MRAVSIIPVALRRKPDIVADRIVGERLVHGMQVSAMHFRLSGRYGLPVYCCGLVRIRLQSVLQFHGRMAGVHALPDWRSGLLKNVRVGRCDERLVIGFA